MTNEERTTALMIMHYRLMLDMRCEGQFPNEEITSISHDIFSLIYSIDILE
jgi:hypothetical protein